MDREGIFTGDDPFGIARRWLEEATPLEPSDPNAAALASVDDDGMPDVRIVLIKDIEHDGFVFFTNYNSRKGQEIANSGKAALNIHWKSLARQIRVRGHIERLSAAESDEYYASRPLGSRIGAWASAQSEPLAKKSDLLEAVQTAEAKHGRFPRRPTHWGGFKITPTEIEFWSAGEFRLHDRFRWSSISGCDKWEITRLNP
ncbi:MAG: pyridoxamine 5'-phosphate oxidase [Marinosulfonomonas sp.]|nr:pyridoxamine 5'-phosphate oxidase [Marinosulfonomonas sp.]